MQQEIRVQGAGEFPVDPVIFNIPACESLLAELSLGSTFSVEHPLLEYLGQFANCV